MSKEFYKFIKNSDKIEKKVIEAFDKDLRDISLLTETAIKNRTPVVTGRLESSMTSRKKEKLDYEVATDVNYALYVEFGTSRFSGRAMMRRGAEDVKRKGKSLLRRSLNVR